MDNLQKHYLQRLAYAQKMALDGYSGTCMNICLELRLEPDLAMHTRALVCLTLCELVEDGATRIVLAEEAERIAKELQHDKHPDANETWQEKYRSMETKAAALRAIYESESGIQDRSDMDVSNIGGKSEENAGYDGGETEMELDDDSDETDRQTLQIPGPNRPWCVEGVFTLNPVTEREDVPTTDLKDKIVADDDDRPSETPKNLPQRVKALAGLPTPPGSSQPSGESQ